MATQRIHLAVRLPDPSAMRTWHGGQQRVDFVGEHRYRRKLRSLAQRGVREAGALHVALGSFDQVARRYIERPPGANASIVDFHRAVVLGLRGDASGAEASFRRFIDEATRWQDGHAATLVSAARALEARVKEQPLYLAAVEEQILDARARFDLDAWPPVFPWRFPDS
jgi:hypothetical protein